MRAFGIGVVGVGDISDVYLANLALYPDIVEVVACAARDLDKARAKAARHGIARAYATPDELFADPDVAIVLDLTHAAPRTRRSTSPRSARAATCTPRSRWGPRTPTVAPSSTRRRPPGLRVGCAPTRSWAAGCRRIRRLLGRRPAGRRRGRERVRREPRPRVASPEPGLLLPAGRRAAARHRSLLRDRAARAARAGRVRGGHDEPDLPAPHDRVRAAPRAGDRGAGRHARHRRPALRVGRARDADRQLRRLGLGAAASRDLRHARHASACPTRTRSTGPTCSADPCCSATPEGARWRGMPRPSTYGPWVEVPVEHPFRSTTHAVNSRGIGLVDMAYAIRDGWPERRRDGAARDGAVRGMLTSAADDRFVRLATTFERPAPLPVDWPAGERR